MQRFYVLCFEPKGLNSQFQNILIYFIFFFFELSSAEATLRHCERLSALVDLQRIQTSERVQEGSAVGGLSGTGHAAGHPAGHPMCLWHCQGSQAARHYHHKGEYQLKALSRAAKPLASQFVSHIQYTVFFYDFFFFCICCICMYSSFNTNKYWKYLNPTLYKILTLMGKVSSFRDTEVTISLEVKYQQITAAACLPGNSKNSDVFFKIEH